ncbi:AMP-binding protein [Nocardia sp. NPDC057668]|uniref:AMP-binding protein n=1 Tax=Nocardia sp. NPDC057668 TaxID=3346202 RepID=UPI003671E945
MFDTVYQSWAENPERFWADQAGELVWTRRWNAVLDSDNAPFQRWFPGGYLNAAENCVDRHVLEGRGDTAAIVFDSPRTGAAQTITYRRLLHEVARFAGVLDDLRVRTGDTVLIHMPAVPQTIVAMLACARRGITHVVVPAVPESVLRDRIEHSTPGVILTASAGFETRDPTPYKSTVDAALAHSAHQPRHCVVLQRPEAPIGLTPRDLDWSQLMAVATARAPIPVESGHPLYLLYTSGSTGKPKAVVRDTGGYLAGLRWAVRDVFGVGPGDVFWTDSHPSWVMGHSFTVYGALVSGCTTLLYEGSPTDTPDAGAFARIIAEHGVSVLSTTPMTLRRIRRAPHPESANAHGGLRGVFLASERVEPGLLDWAERTFDCPVIDNWWQTEAGWPLAANTLGAGLLPGKPGSVTRPLPGCRVEILDDSGRVRPHGVPGNVVLKLPLPPGAVRTLWHDDDRFVATYLKRFPGYYDTSDAGYLDADGYLWITGRTDDIINVGGESLSALDVEEILAAHPQVERCAVVAAPDPLCTQVPVAFVVQRPDSPSPAPDLAAELRRAVTDRLGEWTHLRRFIFVTTLPLTPSQKIRRATLRESLRVTPPDAVSAGPPTEVLDDVALAPERPAPAARPEPAA